MKIGVPTDRQRLLWKGVLLDWRRKFGDYGVGDGAVIQLIANMLPEQASSPSISTHRQSQVQRTQSLTQQCLRTKKHRYLQQRTNGFTIKKQQSLQTLRQNKTIIDQLLKTVQKRPTKNRNANLNANLNSRKQMNDKQLQEIKQPFVLENRQFIIGDWIDVREVSGLWIEGQVVGRRGRFVEVHYNGYPDKWNQWLDVGSDRIMPLRTQTVQTQQSPYLSPFPTNKPQIRPQAPPSKTLSTLLSTLPQTLSNITDLLSQLLSPLSPSHQPPHKYSFNEQQNEEYEAQSFKNNRSHNSPPPSIHEQEYQYDQYQEQVMLEEEEEENYQYTGDDVRGMEPGRDVGRKNQGQKGSSNVGVNINIGKEVRDGGSIKDQKIVTKPKVPTNSKLIRSNRYFNTKKGYLGYSKTKSEHEHPIQHRQQTPSKTPSKIPALDQPSTQKPLTQHQIVQIRNPDQNSQHTYNPPQTNCQMDIQESYPTTNPTPSNIYSSSEYPSYSYPIQLNQPLSDTNIILSPNVQFSRQQQPVDNISNYCQQNMSNKGDHDDGESSAKSFGSKRSERFFDASSMKSLNIQTLGNNEKDNKKDDKKNVHGKKNFFVFDNSQVQSVKNAAQSQDPHKPPQLIPNEGILQQQDSQINEQINEQFYIQKKKDYHKKLRATQLAPLCDRLGRLLVDLAPHLALMGYRQCNQNIQYCENLSTFTNQGSLQSRFKAFNNDGEIEEQQQKSSLQSSRYYNFQIPVMLTPHEISKINKLLTEENQESREAQ